MKATITEDDVRAALPEFLPICTPRLQEEAVRAVRIVALERAWKAACERVEQLGRDCCRAAGALSGSNPGSHADRERRKRYDEVSAMRFRAEERADRLFQALRAEREGRS